MHPSRSKWNDLSAEQKSQRQVERERYAHEKATTEQEPVSRELKEVERQCLLLEVFSTNDSVLQDEAIVHNLEIGTYEWVDFKTDKARKAAKHLDNTESRAIINFVLERALENLLGTQPPVPRGEATLALSTTSMHPFKNLPSIG
jgi:hypothetical protein